MTLETILKPILPELQLVKESLNAQLTQLHEKQKLFQAQKNALDSSVQHFFNAPGKGLRPALVLFSAKLAGPVNVGDPLYQPLIQLAATVELVHSASLIHDDVLDNAQDRRHQESLNGKYGNKIAVLTGDTLFLQGVSTLFHLELADWQKKQKIFQLVCNTAHKMCFGEIFQHQIVVEQRPVKLDEYLTIVEHKTATLMSACCQCGAMLAGDDDTVSETLANFGLHFGLAFQLADDFKDKDSLLDRNADLIAITEEYVEKAKADLQPFNGNKLTKHLTALCDFLLPVNGVSNMFEVQA